MNIMRLTSAFVFLLVAINIALAQVTYLKITTYTDSQCTESNGGFYSQPLSSCSNPYPNCGTMNGVYILGECVTEDPMVAISSNTSFARSYYYTSTDTSCTLKDQTLPYAYAIAAPVDTCFAGVDGTITKFHQCVNNELQTSFFDTTSLCVAGTAMKNVTSTSEQCTFVVNYDTDFKAYCALVPETPVADAPLAAPVVNTAPQANSAPSTSTPVQTPAKKSSASAGMKASLLVVSVVSLLVL